MIEFVMAGITSLTMLIMYAISWLALMVIFTILGFIFGGTPKVYRNYETGEQKVLRKGFSFTYLYFGFLVPLFRGDWLVFIVTLFLSLSMVGHFIVAFIINRIHVAKLLSKGWVEVEGLNTGGFNTYTYTSTGGTYNSNERSSQNTNKEHNSDVVMDYYPED